MEAATVPTEAPKGNPKKSEYHVFWCVGEFENADHALVEGEWKHGGQFASDSNGGQRSARRQAVENSDVLQDHLNEGDTVFFFCLPLRSTDPFAAHMEDAQPTLVV